MPDELMQRFRDGMRGASDEDMVELLWAIIGDVRDSYVLAMKTLGIDPDRVSEIDATVADYLANHYGDS